MAGTIIWDTNSGITLGDGSQLQTFNSLGQRNRIINGGMTIDQRNSGASQSITSSYSIDRWKADRVASGGVVVTGQQVSDAPSGFSNSYKFTVTTPGSQAAGDYHQWAQYIEGYNFADFNWGTATAKPATISFWAKSSLATTLSVGLRDGSFSYSYVIPFTFTTANTWQFFSFTVTPPSVGTYSSTTGYGLDLHFCLGAGTSVGTTTTNTWIASNVIGYTGGGILGTSGATLQITGVQLERGTAPTPFEYRDYGRELAMCQRYCQVLANANSDFDIATGTIYNSTTALVVRSLFVPFRATPSLSYANLSSMLVYAAATNANPSALSLDRAGVSTVTFNATVTGFTAGQGVWLRLNGTDAAITLSAEL